MDFTLTEEHRMLRAMVRDFAEKEMKPVAAGFERRGEYPAQIVARLGSWGSWA